MSTRPASPQPGPRFRSGAVARMAQMPVATLRIWEQRYRAVQPETAASGHRLYSAADVQRVLLLRQLTERGHAIGSIAGLDSGQLARLSTLAEGAGWMDLQAADRSRHAGVAGSDGLAAPVGSSGPRPGSDAAPPDHPVPPPPRIRTLLRVAVVGPALALRLQRPAVTDRLGASIRVVAVFESLADAAQAGPALRADLLLWHAPELQAAPAADGAFTLQRSLEAARQACHARQAAVAYRYAGAETARALADAGATLVREPADDAGLASWLAGIEHRLGPRAGGRGADGAGPAEAGVDGERVGETPLDPEDVDPHAVDAGLRAAPVPSAATVAPRRFDDAALTAIAGLSPSLACECPRHVAELLMQIASFESYSAGCAHRNAEDAALHGYLHQVAATSRALFEAALERVARHEGLALSGLR